jgi:hypothetical protein
MYKATRNKGIKGHKAHLWMMDERFLHIQEAFDGYQQTGVPLVGLDGKDLVPAANTDDVGLSYVVPWLVRHSPLGLERAAAAFLAGVLLVGVTLGYVACCFLYRSWGARVVALAGFCLLALVSFKVKDVYVVEVGLVCGVVPWCLYLCKRTISCWVLGGGLFLGGTAVGAAHTIRAHSGTAVLLFLACILLFSPELERRSRFVALTVLLGGTLVFPLHVHRLILRRDAYLASQNPAYSPTRDGHPFWHATYLGFSYLRNSYVPAFRDELAAAKVCSIAPNAPYVSAEYEHVLRREVFTLVKNHPGFIALTLAAKSGMILFFLLAGANLGLIAAVLYPRPWWIQLGFTSALAFDSFFGLLVIPHLSYLLGFFTFSVLYGILSLCHAIQRGAWGRQMQLLRGLPTQPSSARNECSVIQLRDRRPADQRLVDAGPDARPAEAEKRSPASVRKASEPPARTRSFPR